MFTKNGQVDEEKTGSGVVQDVNSYEKNDLEHKHIENAEDAATQNAYAVKGDESDGKVPMTVRRFIASIILLMSYTGANLPLFFMGGSLTFIAASIPNSGVLGWTTTSYGVALAAITPFTGYLQDILGRRYISITGALLVCIGLAVFGSAKSFVPLIVGSVISGMGAGVTELTAVAGLAETVSVKNRGLMLSLLTVFILPFAPFVLYSQLIAEHATWRWSIWLSLIYNGIVVVGLVLSYFPKSHRRADGVRRAQIWKELDLVGGFLSITGIVLFIVGLQSGGSTYPWKSAHVLAPMIIGILLCFLFIAWEWKGARYPMLPPSIFKGQRVTGTAIAVAFVVGMNLYAGLNFMPLVYAAVYGSDPMKVGLQALGFGLGQTLGATVGNIMMSVFKNHNRENLLFCCILMTAFIGSLATMTPHNPSAIIALSTIGAFGIGGLIAPIATVALSATPDAFIATVVAFLNSARFLGGSIGYSIYYAIFTQKLATRLPASIANYAIEAGLPIESVTAFVTTYLTTPEKVTMMDGVTPQVLAAARLGSQWAYAESLKFVWYTTIPFGILATIGCIAMGKNNHFITNRVAASLG